MAAVVPLAAFAADDRITCLPEQQHFCSFNTGLGKMNCALVKENEFNYINRIDIAHGGQTLILSRWTGKSYDTSPRRVIKFHSPDGVSSRTMIVFEHSEYFLSYLHLENSKFTMYHHLAPFSLHQQLVTGTCQ